MKFMIEAMMATTAAAGATGTPLSKLSPTSAQCWKHVLGTTTIQRSSNYQNYTPA
jgi:hypothetical protein